MNRVAHARERVPVRVLAGRWRTVLLLLSLGRAKTVTRPHEPLPDTGYPGLCTVDWLGVDDPVHRGRPRGKRVLKRWDYL